MRDSNDNHNDFRLDDDGFPMPCLPDLDNFTVKDYQSEEYADAKTVEEAIAMRGHKAFFDNVRPEDFDSGSRANARKVGIAELWSQSTWSAAEKDS